MTGKRPIDRIVTGYEDRFDFPHFAGEPRPYLLATVPRSGSTFFSHLLWRTGCLGAPLERQSQARAKAWKAQHAKGD